jgi:deoxyguanosine kinase
MSLLLFRPLINLWYILISESIPPLEPFMYFAIEGVIGVGKTTLARMLQSEFEAELVLEVFEENPFLSNFYSDRARYAFQTQIFFLLSRYHQQRRNISDRLSDVKAIISDYTFEKDALFARVNLAGDELEMYYRVQEALAEKVTSPDLFIYLRANTDTLMKRIALRDRPYERQMERSYIDQLNNSYEDFFIHSPLNSPVLVIESSEMDFVNNPADYQAILNRIREALKLAPFQPQLPIS